MSFVPYLHFTGTCRQAMTAYPYGFGGVRKVSPYGDAPDVPPEAKASDLLMQASLSLGDGRMLLASDAPPGFPGAPQQAVSISHVAPSADEGRRLFGLLADGGTVVLDYAPTFWSDGFGIVKDRFGTHWMVSAPWRQPEAH
jgi:PhnB protein